MSTFQQATLASALGILANLLYEKMLTFSPSESWIKGSYLKLGLFSLEAPLDIPVFQKLPSSHHTCFTCEQGPL